jgi:hypothetical protein
VFRFRLDCRDEIDPEIPNATGLFLALRFVSISLTLAGEQQAGAVRLDTLPPFLGPPDRLDGFGAEPKLPVNPGLAPDALDEAVSLRTDEAELLGVLLLDQTPRQGKSDTFSDTLACFWECLNPRYDGRTVSCCAGALADWRTGSLSSCACSLVPATLADRVGGPGTTCPFAGVFGITAEKVLLFLCCCLS